VRCPQGVLGRGTGGIRRIAQQELTSEDVVTLCRGKIASYRMPRDVKFIADDKLPYGDSGKVKRHKLEARLVAELNDKKIRIL